VRAAPQCSALPAAASTKGGPQREQHRKEAAARGEEPPRLSNAILTRTKKGGVQNCRGKGTTEGGGKQEDLDKVFDFNYIDETFSPVARLDTMRILLNLANKFGLEGRQFDVKTAFLHGTLDEGIFMLQPEGFEQGEDHLVCLLKKSIYGLKQASRSWNQVFTSSLRKFDLCRLSSDTCVCYKKHLFTRYS